ncbi:APC family permease [Propionibacteriaceae bacterium Y2011]|uniref:APC family permease n=1 Tax=Microlunatus sp. Y2014 TaxID=3418488 RepID=UPI003B4C32D2
MTAQPPATQPPTAEARTGDRTTLERSLKPQWVWAVALGSAIGWGAFVLPTDWMATAGPLGTIIGLSVGAALMCLIAVSYGFLIRTFPVSGGEYAYAYTAFGRLHAYICGWFLTLGYTSIVALNASALALLFRRMVPWVVEWVPLWEIAGWQVYLGEVVVASLALVLFAVFNVLGTTLSGRMQFVFCLIMLAAVALLLIGVLVHPGASLGNLVPGFPDGAVPLSATLAIVAIAPWAFVGFDNVPQAAEEFDFAPSKAFGLIILAIIAAAGIYVAMVLATGAAGPWTELVAGEPVWGTADRMAGLFGPIGLLALAVGVAMGVFTGLNGFFISASRLLFAMGRAHTIPSVFAKVHPRTGTPTVAIWFVAAVCLVAPWFGREALVWVVDMSSVGVTIAYTYTCLAAFRMFRLSGAPERPGEPEGVRSTVKKVMSGVGALVGVGFFLLLMTPGSPAQLGIPSLVALGVWVVLGAIFFLWHRARQTTRLTDQEMDHLVLGEHRQTV